MVFLRDFRPRVDADDPRRSFPYISGAAPKFVVPIYPEYHTELLPDSILRTEDPEDFEDNRSNRNALSKVYISRSYERGLKAGDIIVFYRTAEPGKPAWYTSVATTLGVVQDVIDHIRNFETFLGSADASLLDDKLKEHWDYTPHNRPFVVNFLYVYSFPKRPNLSQLDRRWFR